MAIVAPRHRGISAALSLVAVVCVLAPSIATASAATPAQRPPACGDGDLLSTLPCTEEPEADSDRDDPRFADGRFFPSPPGGDIVADWVTAHLAYPARRDALASDESLVSTLATGTPPYRSLNRDAVLFGDDAGRATRVLAAAAGRPISRAGAATALAWDLGLTASIPWITTRKAKVTSPANAHARASMIKAGVESDIYQQARRLAGEGRVVLAANLALAAQAARDRRGHLREPTSVALLAGTPGRFMAAQGPEHLTDTDLAALMRELESVLSAWPGGELSVHGKRQLPAGWRLARLAAAYDDEFRHDAATHPCDSNGMPVVGTASPRPVPLCIDAATDRDIAAWYARAYRTELTGWRKGPPWSAAHLRLLGAVESVLPFWAGVLHPSARLAPYSVELARQLVATQASDALFYPEPITGQMFHAAGQRLCSAVSP